MIPEALVETTIVPVNEASTETIAAGNLESEGRQPDATPQASDTESLEAALLAAKHASPDEAFTVLCDAAVTFPGVAQVHHDLARVAERRSDWTAAEWAWQNFIAVNPSKWFAFAGLAASLRRQGRLEEAEVVLLDSESRFPKEPWPMIERARLAQLRGDWNSALLQWNTAFAAWPDRWECAHGRATALARLGFAVEADEIIEATIGKFPAQPELLHDFARLAERRGDWATAEQTWRSFISVEPRVWWALVGLASALRQQERVEEAKAVLETALQQFPNERVVVAEHARVVGQPTAKTMHSRADEDEPRPDGAAAMPRPSLADAHRSFRRLATLINERKFAEFDAERSALPETLRADHGIMSLWCSAARMTGDWQATMSRAAEMAEHWPNSTQPLAFRIYGIAGSQGYNEARGYIDECLAKHSKDLDILNAVAEVAKVAEDFERVIEICLRVRSIGERHFGPHLRHAQAVAHHGLGQFELAATLVTEGLRAYPQDPLLKIDARSWGIREPEPEPEYVLPIIANPRSSYVAMRDHAEIEARTGLTPQDLVTKFDSLGENCEFGFLQRAVGAEPISLMRFAGMRWEEMTFALNAGFEGIDSPNNLMAKVENGCWDIRDRRYNIAYHTFLPVATTPEDRLLSAQARRLRWLADKLIADLQSGEKSFVAWRTRIEDGADILPLLRAVRRYGNATIIMVEAGGGDAGVEEVATGLLRGRVGRFRPEGSELDVEGWLAMLGNAWLLAGQSENHGSDIRGAKTQHPRVAAMDGASPDNPADELELMQSHQA